METKSTLSPYMAKKGRFWVDDLVVEELPTIVGAIATLVYICLVRHADSKGRCFPSYRLIAKELHLARSSVVRHVAKLKDAGVIGVARRRSKAGDRTSNAYYLNPFREWLQDIWDQEELWPDMDAYEEDEELDPED